MKTFKYVNKRYFVVSALVITGALLVWFYSPSLKGGSRGSEDIASHHSLLTSAGIVHPATVMQADLYPTLDKASEIPTATEQVYGGIVSHHFYMEEEISKLFLQLRNQSPSVVVIVGPNHFNAGNSDIQTSTAPYVTPFGQLDPDLPLISRLVADGAASHEEFAFEREHSIAALVSFTKKVFPHTKLLPIIIRRNTSPARTEQLSVELEKILPKDALVLASVDFSHHLDRFAADFHDSQSVPALLSADFNRIRNVEVDSPQSLEVLMRYLQSRGALHMKYKNTNQAVYGGNVASDDVTSYVFAGFTKGSSLTSGSVTFLHLGSFDADTLESNEGQTLYALGGPENNFLRGTDLKVVGATGNDCALNSVPSLARYKLQIFRAGKCSERVVIGNDVQTGHVGFIYVGTGDDVQTLVMSARENYNYIVVQSVSSEEARGSLDAGASAAFIDDGASKIELYKNRPIIHLASSGKSGFSAGIVFNPISVSNIKSGSPSNRASAILYIFPYQTKNNQLIRPEISERLKSCKQILSDLKNTDGCMVSVQ